MSGSIDDSLLAQTLGDPGVCVAILDGPVDLSHLAFRGAALTLLNTLANQPSDQGLAAQHGTHVASVVFGQVDGPVRGIVPRCRGLIVPIFRGTETGGVRPCSQLDLARGIALALENGANVINISGGQLETSSEAEPMLAAMIKQCADQHVLVVAAAGNDGCSCLHVPASIPSVLVVGAMNAAGEPMEFSNWGESYRDHGVLALGEGILGAVPNGGVAKVSGTSFATPIVSGTAALLLSLLKQRGEKLDALAVREAILKSAINCDVQPASDCRRLLSGRFNPSGALNYLVKGKEETMSEEKPTPPAAPSTPALADTNQIQPAACGCGGGCGSKAPSAPPQKIYALGQIDYDFGTEANRDAFQQLGVEVPEDRRQMARYFTHFSEEVLSGVPKPEQGTKSAQEFAAALAKWDQDVKARLRSQHVTFANQAYSEQLTWLLTQDGTPLYAIHPIGPFAQHAYLRFTEFLEEQAEHLAEMIALPGTVIGKTRLMNGQEVPVVAPDLRGLCNWSIAKLVAAAANSSGAADSAPLQAELVNFLHRVYFEIRNLGATSRERAINFAATNILQTRNTFAQAIHNSIFNTTSKLDTIDVERSANCRHGADCWDVKLTFFEPAKRLESPKQVFRFTVDVSEPLPVAIGTVRSWLVN